MPDGSASFKRNSPTPTITRHARYATDRPSGEFCCFGTVGQTIAVRRLSVLPTQSTLPHRINDERPTFKDRLARQAILRLQHHVADTQSTVLRHICRPE